MTIYLWFVSWRGDNNPAHSSHKIILPVFWDSVVGNLEPIAFYWNFEWLTKGNKIKREAIKHERK
jgi:hypothetical protein